MRGELKKRISNGDAVITVMGLGYVGLPIAMEFCRKGYPVYGLDNDRKRVDKLRRGTSYVEDIDSDDVAGIKRTGRFMPTCDTGALNKADVVIVCVPTPLRKTTEPDISYILEAGRTLSKRMRRGQLIIVESTTYPGTTREVILPELEKSGYRLDEDFFLAFSPERIDPGNARYGLTNIPKIVGGVTPASTGLAKSVYSRIIKKVIPVESAEAAEVTKLLENTFRIVNIGLINEFAMLCHKLGIDVWEVIEAAKTKPFGFMPFYPGPGIGGYCIPADPMYLSWKGRTVGFRTEMIDLAAGINRLIPGHIVDRLRTLLRQNGKKLSDSSVLVLGAAYKKDVNDVRESPALEIIADLMKGKAEVSYHDPYIRALSVREKRMRSRKLTAAFLRKRDAVIIVTDHSGVDYPLVAEHSRLVFDTRNVMEKKGIKGQKIVKL
jgi:UDP-N-acetyl-D-glucosamine dehydrogenase